MHGMTGLSNCPSVGGVSDAPSGGKDSPSIAMLCVVVARGDLLVGGKRHELVELLERRGIDLRRPCHPIVAVAGVTIAVLLAGAVLMVFVCRPVRPT